jgi:hypothetical protein
MVKEKFIISRGRFSSVMPYDKDAIYAILKSSRQYRRISLPSSGRMNPDAEFCHKRSSDIASGVDSYPNKVPEGKPPLGTIILKIKKDNQKKQKC